MRSAVFSVNNDLMETYFECSAHKAGEKNSTFGDVFTLIPVEGDSLTGGRLYKTGPDTDNFHSKTARLS